MCHSFNVLTEQWDTKKLPRLKIERFEHSSLAIDNYVYVICGSNDVDKLDSIERLQLQVSDDGWVS